AVQGGSGWIRAAARRLLVDGARSVYHAVPLPDSVRLAVSRAMLRRRGLRDPASHRPASAAGSGSTRAVGAAVVPAMVATPADRRRREAVREAIRRANESELDEFLASNTTISLPDPGGAPLVTVILVLYNQAPLTLACL